MAPWADLRPLSIAASAWIATAPVAAEAAPIAAGTWAVEYQVDDCTLSRDDPAAGVGVAIRTKPLSEPHDLMLYGMFAPGRERSVEGTIAIGERTMSTRRWMVIERSRRGKRTVLKTTITGDELARLGESGRLWVSGPGDQEIVPVLPDLRKPLTALRECEIYLAGRWGITRQEILGWAIPARPIADLRELFWDRDRTKIAMLQSDSIRGVLTIDASGNMIDCTIVEATRIAWVNDRFCRTLKERARFEPARDADGRAVIGKVVTPPIRSARLH